MTYHYRGYDVGFTKTRDGYTVQAVGSAMTFEWVFDSEENFDEMCSMTEERVDRVLLRKQEEIGE